MCNRRPSSIARLNLSENKLSAAEIGKLLEVLRDNEDLVELNMAQKVNLSGGQVLAELCEFLIRNKTLKKLVLNIEISAGLVLV